MAVMTTPEAQQAAAHKQTHGGKAATGAPALSFPSQAMEHVEPISDSTFTPGASQVSLGTFDVPAFGYLRSILFLVQATGGTGTAAVLAGDGPWSCLSAVSLADVNGQPLFGPYEGYDMYLAHLFGGGVSFDSDPTHSPAYSAPTTAGNFSFLLRLPVEITSRDALGALSNQNAASAYKLHIEAAPITRVWSTSPTGVPAIRVRTYLEAWSQPASGATPPALGTTQYWSKQVINAAAGAQTWRVQRVGNALRTLVAVTRDNTGARVSNIWPDPISVNIDGKQLVNALPAAAMQHYMQERYGIITALPTGVYVFDYTHDFDGKPGGELRDLYLRTTSATRLELTGVAGGTPGTVTLMVNDVASFAGAGV